MINDDGFCTFLSIGIVVIIVLAVIVVHSSTEVYECSPLEQNGQTVKIENVFVQFDKVCFIECNDKFIPESKWVVNTGD